MKLLPVALNVQTKNCLVVGGGKVASRKVASLLECEAKVTIIAPHLDENFGAIDACKYLQRVYQRGDVNSFDLVFACTNVREVNAQIGREARELKIWCNLADDAPSSDFHGAATVRRGEICIGISTGGGSPALSKHLKNQVAQSIGPEYETVLHWLQTRRAVLSATHDDTNARGDKWRAVLKSEVLELCCVGREDEAEQLLDEILNKS